MKRVNETVLLVALTATWSLSACATDSSRAERVSQMLNGRFASADANGDGQLSSAEAKSGMPFVSRHFAEIDTENRGSITLEQIRGYFATQAASRATAKP